MDLRGETTARCGFGLEGADDLGREGAEVDDRDEAEVALRGVVDGLVENREGATYVVGAL